MGPCTGGHVATLPGVPNHTLVNNKELPTSTVVNKLYKTSLVQNHQTSTAGNLRNILYLFQLRKQKLVPGEQLALSQWEYAIFQRTKLHSFYYLLKISKVDDRSDYIFAGNETNHF